MKNFLLTCFLALLCLVGRYLAASSRVADSPPEDPLHRSGSVVSPHSGDTHRGGAILSDTLPRIDFGLIDKHLDPGAGEGTSVLQPAPVTVFDPNDETAASLSGAPRSDASSHLSYMKNPPNQLSLELSGEEVLVSRLLSPNDETASIRTSARSDLSNLPSSVSGLRSPYFSQGFSLVDDSISQGQEEGNTPARVGEAVSSDSLRIGDQLPSGIEFRTVLNNKEEPIHLDDYRNKYLILQFWAPSCSASIGSLPKTAQLNEQFGDRLTILPVTVFSEAQIRETLEAFPTLGALDLPMAVEAKEVYRYFPHSVIPHFVVLSPEGEVLAITGLEDMTEKNLKLLVNENQISFRTKSDTQIRLDPASKLISENPQISNKNIWFQSAFTGYIPEVSGSLIQNYDEFSHIRIVNMTLIYHYRLAYSERSLTDYFGKNRIETIGFDQDELEPNGIGLDYKDWKAEGGHVFGYELIAPIHLNSYALMREDLKRFLPHIEATVETKARTVLALVQQEGKIFSKSSASQKSYNASPQGLNMRLYPLDGFVYHLNAGFLRTNPIPIINRTGIDYPIDLDLDARLTDVESLRAALRQNGLDLIERVEEIPVLVLKKTENTKLIGQ